MSSSDMKKPFIDLRQLDVELSKAASVPTGFRACYQNDYTTEYNFAVTNWNTLECSAEKKQMLNGYFLLNRIFIAGYLVLAACSIIPLVLIAKYTGFIAIPIIVTCIYTTLFIYNAIIFRRNGKLDHSRMRLVEEENLKGFANEFFTIPRNGPVKDQRLVEILDKNALAVITDIQQLAGKADPVTVMVYNGRYQRYQRFPIEAIIQMIIMWSFTILVIALGATAGNIPWESNLFDATKVFCLFEQSIN